MIPFAKSCLLAMALLGPVASAASQALARWDLVDGPSGAVVAFDSTRTRLVALDLNGSTYEWSGVWHRVPALGPGGQVRNLVYDAVRRRTVAFGDVFLAAYDGVAWVPLAAPVPLATMTGLAFDQGRGRLVALASGATW